MTAVCGTDKGYQRHRALRDVPCAACNAAHAATNRHNRAWQRHHPIVDEPLRYAAARAGREPAEALTTADRARLIAELVTRGWPVADIAAHCRMTAYTTCRIRDRLVAAGVITPPQPHRETA